MNLLIFVVGTGLAIIAARPLSPPRLRRAATAALIALMVIAPFITSSTSILFDALTAMCIAYGWNIIGGFAGYAAFGNVAYLGLGAFVAAGFMSRQPGHLAWPWFVGIPLAVVIVSLIAGAVGIVVLRLRGHYFSIATLGVGVAMPQVITSDAAFGSHGLFPNFFGGGLPLNFPLAADWTVLGAELSADRYFFYYLALLTALARWPTTSVSAVLSWTPTASFCTDSAWVRRWRAGRSPACWRAASSATAWSPFARTKRRPRSWVSTPPSARCWRTCSARRWRRSAAR